MPSRIPSVSGAKVVKALESADFEVGDDQLFVNTHIYGVMAKKAPFFHFRKIPGGAIAINYLESFERSGTMPSR